MNHLTQEFGTLVIAVGWTTALSDRACLTGILFGPAQRDSVADVAAGIGLRIRHDVLETGDWQEEGVWDLMHFALLNWLARDGDIDWSRAIVDSCSVRAVCGGTQTVPESDRPCEAPGSERHVICDGQGLPLLAVPVTGANCNDSQEALEKTLPRAVDCPYPQRTCCYKVIRGLGTRRRLPRFTPVWGVVAHGIV